MPPALRDRRLRVDAQHTFVSQPMAESAAERRAQLQTARDARRDKLRQLMHLKGSGLKGAWLLVREFFGGRACKKRRAVGG
jgi:hypothetical protein